MSEDEEWVKHVLNELVPMVNDSVCTMSIVPETGFDVKFAVELGVSIMLDKPVILLVSPGTVVPDHLRRVADEIVECDWSQPGSFDDRMHAAMDRVLGIDRG